MNHVGSAVLLNSSQRSGRRSGRSDRRDSIERGFERGMSVSSTVSVIVESNELGDMYKWTADLSELRQFKADASKALVEKQKEGGDFATTEGRGIKGHGS